MSEQDSTSSVDLKEPAVKAKEPKTPSKTALKKAEAEKKRAEKARRALFDNQKAELAREFFNSLDQTVTGGRVSQLAEPTGGVSIIWSKTLRRTAGRAHWRGERPKDADDRSIPGAPMKHHAKIELAEHVVDNETRLINIIAHEYCHLANYMISGVHDNPHGASFKAWGQKCAAAFDDTHPYGGKIKVTTTHRYEIDYKYVWACVDCGTTYGRHSKSIDTTRYGCGRCKGKMEQIKPKPRKIS